MAAKTILVVEDDDATREWFGSVLRQGGYQVVLVQSGQDALDYLQSRGTADLIMLDMFMPGGMDGWHFLKLWKRHWHHVPVLVTTALKIGSDEWATSLGACGWLEKPVDGANLLAKVRECVEQNGAD